MALTWAGTTYGTNNRADLSLRPGIYWLTVRDAFTFHNYALRSCPDGASPCTSGDVRTITTIPGTPGEVTDELLLSQGTHRLFCALGSHEAQGMYVDFQVGGVGQLD